MPAIIDGPLYGAFHGIISVAYGIFRKSDKVLLEGLLFMDIHYSPMMWDQYDNPKVDISCSYSYHACVVTSWLVYPCYYLFICSLLDKCHSS